MNRHPRMYMGNLAKSLLMVSLMLCSALAGCIFEDDGDGPAEEVLAVFKFSPNTNIKAGMTVSFDASDSMPNDGSLTYRWNFDVEGSTDIDATGQTATWSFDEAKTYEVMLEVSNGITTAEQTREVTVVPESAEPPTAEITQYADEEDCEDDSISESQRILVWICAYEKSMTDRSITETITINLDASGSTSGDDTSQYIPTDGYAWDLNLNEDKDNDGDSENDDDLVGETVEWNNVRPGEYEIGLTVTNDVGMSDHTTIKVYVNYAGYWKDFEMAGNTSGNTAELDFDALIHHNKDSGNTIARAQLELEYPKEDDDCFNTPGNNCRAELNIFAYNEEDEEASNTTSTDLESRDEGDCDAEQDCVHLSLFGYVFSDSDTAFGEGEWTMTIQNDRVNDFRVDRFVIRLYYK